MTGVPAFLDRDRLRSRVIAVLVIVVAVSVLVLGVVSVWSFDRAVEPELLNRTRLIGSVVRSEVQRALDRGIPLDALAGLDDYLKATLDDFDEIERIRVASARDLTVAIAERAGSEPILPGARFADVILARRAAVALPILDGNRLVGEIEVVASPRVIQARLRDVFLDIMVIALVATLFALELVLATVARTVGMPLGRVLRLLQEQGRGVFLHRVRPGGIGALRRASVRLNDRAADLAERLAGLSAARSGALPEAIADGIARPHPARLRLSDVDDMRLALFLLAVGSEIAASFLPIYARGAVRPAWLAADLAAAAPLLVYLAAIAAVTPFAGPLVRRLGARRLFVASMPPIALGLVGMGVASSVVEIAVWRGVIGAAYATASAACQLYAIGAAGEGGTGRAASAAVAVIFGGVFCGSAIGGVIAARFGFTVTFVIAAVIVAGAGALAFKSMTGRAGLPHPASAPAAERVGRGRLLTVRYVALVIGISIPLNIATSVFIWFLTPLMLAASGHGTAETARVVMLYYLVIALFGTSLARFAERWPGPIAVISGGAVASGAALLSLSAWGGFWAIASAVTALGFAHSFVRAPQYALSARLAAEGAPGLLWLGLYERLGAILGLAATAFVLDDIGADASIRMLAVVVLSGAALFALVWSAARTRGQ